MTLISELIENLENIRDWKGDIEVVMELPNGDYTTPEVYYPVNEDAQHFGKAVIW